MKRLFHIVLLALTALGVTDVEAQTPNVWLKADGNLLDSAGTNNGILVNPISYTAGISGQAFYAEGGAIRVPNSPALQPASNVTVQAWVKGTAPGAFAYIVSKSRSGFGSYAIYTGNGGVAFFVAKGTTLLVSPQATAATIWDDNWHQVTGVYDGTNSLLYVDGVFLGASTATTPGNIDYNTAANNGDLILANLNPTVGGGNFYVGALDEVKIFGTAMSASDVSDTFNNPVSTAATNGLIAWYKGEGNLLDSWGGNNGTLINPAAVSYLTGKSGQALLAPKGLVQIPDSPSFETTNITVQAWVQGVAPAAFQYIVTKAREGQPSYALYTGSAAGATFILATDPNNSSSFVTSPSVPGLSIWDGAWHQLTGVYDGSNALIYLDGIEVGSGTATNFTIPYSTNLAAGNVIVGNNTGFSGAFAFSGLIDDLKIYDHALQPSEVLASFTAGTLVSWWEAETNANDILGVNNGSLSGSVSYAASRLTGKAFHTTAGAVVIPNSVTLQPANVTVEAMLRAGPPGTNKYIISKSFNSTNASYALYSGANGGLTFYIALASGIMVSPSISASAIWDGNFHAVAGTYDGQSVRLYVDGMQVGNGTPATGAIQYGTSQSSGELLFGDFADTLTASNFNGVIDEVKLYNVGLPAQSVLADTFQSIIITSQPVNQTIVQGSNATFSVAQLGKTPLAYQWQFNGTNLVGATNATLTVTNSQTINVGSYSVLISAGSVRFTTNSPFGIGESFQLSQGTVTVPNDPSLQPPSLSLQCWVRQAGTPGTFKYVLSKSRGTGVASYAFYTAAEGGLRFYIAAPGNPGFFATPYIDSTNIWDGAWHQITGTFTDQSIVHLYVDAQEVGSGTDSFLSSILYTPGAFSGDLLLGDFSATSIANHFPGDLDDVKLFDHELSASDVQDTFTNPGGDIATNGLISWWKGDGNALDTMGLNPGILPPPGFAQSSQATLTLSVPAVLTNANVFNGSFHATVTGGSFTNYIVQKSADLIHWSPFITNAVPYSFSDPVNANAKQFYRGVAQ